MDRYRERRSPERERGYHPAPMDSYIPSTSIRAARPRSRSPGRYRPRSRSPPRPQADTWRSRPRSRSPPRRFDDRTDAYSARDYRDRSPPRRDFVPPDGRYDDGSRLGRARSPPPVPKRIREGSPPGRGGRTPPPMKRERIRSPPRDYVRPLSPPPRRSYVSPPPIAKNEYRKRSRSPPRHNDYVDPYAVKSWRRKSPSPRPVRVEQRSGEGSGRDSVATSRRSSPRAYAREAGSYRANDVGPTASTYRAQTNVRTPAPSYPLPSAGHRSPSRDEVSMYDARAGPGTDREYSQPEFDANVASRDNRAPPTGPSYKDSRAPPTGPSSASRHVAPPAMSPPVGPSSTPVSISAHSRPASAGIPTHPRGGGGYRGRGGMGPSTREYPTREYPPTGPASGRGGRGGNWTAGASYTRGPPPTRDSASGQEGGYSYDARSRGGPLPHRDSMNAPPPPGFRGSSNSTSTTYPRTQRFNAAGVPQTPASAAIDAHLADLPTIKPEGERLPPLHDMSKADRLEEEAARLRKAIDEKQAKKRAGLREWERLERESKTAGLRTELAEEALRGLSSEGDGLGVGGVAAF